MENKPWIPYLATEYIILRWPRVFERPLRIFEWGSGDSTLFFLDNGAHVVSIEHDSEFYEKLNSTLWRDNWKVEYKLIPPEQGEIGPDKANPAHYKSGSTQLGNVNFKRYVSVIDDYGLFDLILIDGMARASCIHHAFSHVAPGDCMVIDNTGDRPYYLEQTLSLFGNYESGWERIDFMGYGPILDYKWQTTFFINRAKRDYESR